MMTMMEITQLASKGVTPKYQQHMINWS